MAFSDFPQAMCSDTEIMATFFLAQANKNINTMAYTECLRNYLLFEVYTHNCLISFAVAQHLCTELTTLS